MVKIYFLIGMLFCIGIDFIEAASCSIKEEEVSFQSKQDEIILSGTITMPDDMSGSTPIFVLLHGQGGMDRDMLIRGRRPFLKIAQYLAQHGIATLRYDKRGIGASEGELKDSTTYDLMDDAYGAVTFLRKKRKMFSKIGLLGFGEGGVVATGVAAYRSDINSLILLAPAFCGKNSQHAVDVIELLLRADGASEGLIQISKNLYDHLYDIIRTVSYKVAAKEALILLFQNYFEMLSSEEKIELGKLVWMPTEENFMDKVNLYNGAWHRTLFFMNPYELLEKVDCPTLLLTGELDFMTSIKHIVDVVERGFKGVNLLTHINLKKHNHAFLPVETGSFAEYLNALDDISDETVDTRSTA